MSHPRIASYWGENWFISLPDNLRLLYTFLFQQCDASGLCEPEMYEYQLASNSPIQFAELLEATAQGGRPRIIKVAGEKYFFCDHFRNLYGESFNPSHTNQRGVLRFLINNKISLSLLDVNFGGFINLNEDELKQVANVKGAAVFIAVFNTGVLEIPLGTAFITDKRERKDRRKPKAAPVEEKTYKNSKGELVELLDKALTPEQITDVTNIVKQAIHSYLHQDLKPNTIIIQESSNSNTIVAQELSKNNTTKELEGSKSYTTLAQQLYNSNTKVEQQLYKDNGHIVFGLRNNDIKDVQELYDNGIKSELDKSNNNIRVVLDQSDNDTIVVSKLSKINTTIAQEESESCIGVELKVNNSYTTVAQKIDISAHPFDRKVLATMKQVGYLKHTEIFENPLPEKIFIQYLDFNDLLDDKVKSEFFLKSLRKIPTQIGTGEFLEIMQRAAAECEGHAIEPMELIRQSLCKIVNRDFLKMGGNFANLLIRFMGFTKNDILDDRRERAKNGLLQPNEKPVRETVWWYDPKLRAIYKDNDRTTYIDYNNNEQIWYILDRREKKTSCSSAEDVERFKKTDEFFKTFGDRIVNKPGETNPEKIIPTFKERIQ